MLINNLNDIIVNTFQIIILGSFFMLASKFILHSLPGDVTGLLANQLRTNKLDMYNKRIAPEKISLSKQRRYKRKVSLA